MCVFHVIILHDVRNCCPSNEPRQHHNSVNQKGAASGGMWHTHVYPWVVPLFAEHTHMCLCPLAAAQSTHSLYWFPLCSSSSAGHLINKAAVCCVVLFVFLHVQVDSRRNLNPDLGVPGDSPTLYNMMSSWSHPTPTAASCWSDVISCCTQTPAHMLWGLTDIIYSLTSQIDV